MRNKDKEEYVLVQNGDEKFYITYESWMDEWLIPDYARQFERIGDEIYIYVEYPVKHFKCIGRSS